MKRIASLVLSAALLCTAAAAEDVSSPVRSDYSCVAELKAAGLAKAREAEEEGLVLLKNEGSVLPLAAGSRVSLFGITSVDPVYGGTGSGAVETGSAMDFVGSFEAAGLEVTDTDLIGWYREQLAESNLGRGNYAIGEGKWSRVKRHLGKDSSQIRGTAAFFVIGRVGGEGADMTDGAEKEDAALDGTDYLLLNDDEAGVLKALAELKAEGVLASLTVIINSANPLSASFLFDEACGVDAALWAGSLGQAGAEAVGRAAAGLVNPSGCLPDTWWMDSMDDPVMNNFGSTAYLDAEEYFPGRSYYEYTRYVVYQEGIYLGYRYTETRYTDAALDAEGAGSFDYDKTVAFPFGYGLSYTDFELDGMFVTAKGEGRTAAYEVTVRVTNTGSRSGRKTVQIYARKPWTEYDIDNGIEKAAAELVGYGKTGLLAPGESESVTVTVPEYFLTSYDAENTEVFILDEGTYSLICAENAHDAAERLLADAGADASADPAPSAEDPLLWHLWKDFDDETYADAYGTGEPVMSLFSFADINRYDGAEDNETVYYSRTDWEGTVTEGPVALTMTELMASDLELTDDDLPGGGEFPAMGIDAGLVLSDLAGAGFDDPLWDTYMDQFTFEELSLLCLTGLRETAAVERLGKPATLDHNGPTGVTQRYNCMPGGNGYAVTTNDPDAGMTGTCYPCNGILAATFNDSLVEEIGRLVGEDAMWAGYAGIYGTGLNLHRSPYAGRVFEYFSEDSVLTGMMGAAWTRGVQSRGVYVYSKHLVLNEQEENRAGLGTWCNEQALRELYLRAFELPIVYANARCVMSAFNRLGALWCGASYDLMTSWLRDEAGMTGFAVTDMYDRSYMVGANQIAAGNDIPDGELLRSGYSLSAYAPDGETPSPALCEAMRLSAKRVLYTVLHSRGMEGAAAPQ